jgi:hypothetical protein
MTACLISTVAFHPEVNFRINHFKIKPSKIILFVYEFENKGNTLFLMQH